MHAYNLDAMMLEVAKADVLRSKNIHRTIYYENQGGKSLAINHCFFELFTFAVSQIKYIADISLLLMGNFPTRSYPNYSSPFGSVAYVCIKHFAFLFVSHLHAISDVLLTITGICNGALKFP